MSFAAAAFLAGLGYLALPWWLHRRHSDSREARVVGSLMLMEPAETPQQRRRQLQHRLLLACRMLLLLVLCLAFAQPLLERRAGPGAAAATLPRLIVLDTSMSMRAAGDTARQRAVALLNELPPGVAAAVATADAEVTLLSPLGTDRQASAEALARATPGSARLSFDGLLGGLGHVADALTREPLEIHLISDFQATAIPEQFNGLIADGKHPVVLHAVPGAVENWRIHDLQVDAAITVRVSSFARRARSLRVTLQADGRDVETRDLEVEPHAQASVTFLPPEGIERGGAVMARLDGDDAIPGDDLTFAVVNPLDRVPLPVYAGPRADRQQRYLSAALHAGGLRFEPATLAARGRVAVLLDPGALDGTSERQLRRHIEQGGSLLLTAGPETERAGRIAGLDLALSSRRLQHDVSGVAALDRSHPVLDAAAWRSVRVYRHVVPATTEAGNVLISTDDGAPLLLELPLNSGRALLLTTALDPDWSNLVSEAAFVEFVHQALAYLAEDWMPETAVAGAALTLPVAGVQVFDVAGARLLTLGETVGRAGLRLDRPGIYTLRTPSRSTLLAVNVDARESDPATAPQALLERWQKAVGASVDGAVPASSAALPSVFWPLAPWLLIVLVALALIEAVSANSSRSRGGVA